MDKKTLTKKLKECNQEMLGLFQQAMNKDPKKYMAWCRDLAKGLCYNCELLARGNSTRDTDDYCTECQQHIYKILNEMREDLKCIKYA